MHDFWHFYEKKLFMEKLKKMLKNKTRIEEACLESFFSFKNTIKILKLQAQ